MSEPVKGMAVAAGVLCGWCVGGVVGSTKLCVVRRLITTGKLTVTSLPLMGLDHAPAAAIFRALVLARYVLRMMRIAQF